MSEKDVLIYINDSFEIGRIEKIYEDGNLIIAYDKHIATESVSKKDIMVTCLVKTNCGITIPENWKSLQHNKSWQNENMFLALHENQPLLAFSDCIQKIHCFEKAKFNPLTCKLERRTRKLSIDKWQPLPKPFRNT